ncbi:hypothetical protein ABT404_27215 [Streptomyces hyaluromycini]|uniref:Uncharacterized protein n=1 Tax=Streptomyces hyaluromycini TaxID=1377993 RepID=A0ABV1X268_9ACTN
MAEAAAQPPLTEATRRLSAAAHARPDRLEPVRTAFRHLRTRGWGIASLRALLSGEPAVGLPTEETCPPLGEPLAKWAIGQVLLSPARVVPSYGFDLGPVLAHSLAARRQWRIRRAALVAVLGWVAYRCPTGVSLWALAAILALLIARPPRRVLSRSSWRFRVSRVWGAVCVFVLLPVLVISLSPTSRESEETLLAAELAMAAFLAVRIVDRLVAALYALACDRGRRRPWTGPRQHGRIAAVERAQTHDRLPYERYITHWRFIGVGKSLWGRSTISIKLQAEEDEDEEVRKDFEPFDTDELLRAVSEDLEDLRISEPPFNPLECEVRYVVGGPDRRWWRLPSDPPTDSSETDDAWGQAQDEAASGHVVRRYLSAQVNTWSGQLVITVLASAVIEGQELHFAMRPHVLSPLFEEVEEAVDPEQLARVGTFVQIPLQAVGDLVGLGHNCWRFLRRWAREGDEPAAADEVPKVSKRPMPTSLRERYSPVYTDDMHVSEDAVRHVAIIQKCMFDTVQEFLEHKGVDVTEFKRQAQKIMNIIYAGDNNIIQAVAAGRDAHGVHQGWEGQGRQPSDPGGRGEKANAKAEEDDE